MPQVATGASELLVESFSEAGKQTRVAVGVKELPLNAAVEPAVWVESAGQGENSACRCI